MADRRSPAEKKVLSYQRDRRNTYGETGARSRYSIRRRKAGVNRAYRHAVREELALAARDTDVAEDPADLVRRKQWRKVPDAPLGAMVARKHARRLQSGGLAASPTKIELQLEAKRRRSQSGDRPMETW